MSYNSNRVWYRAVALGGVHTWRAPGPSGVFVEAMRDIRPRQWTWYGRPANDNKPQRVRPDLATRYADDAMYY